MMKMVTESGQGNKPAATSEGRLAIRHYLTKSWKPQQARVLVIGDSMLDIYVSGVVDRISPEAPVPIVRHGRTRESAGGAANVAGNICSLGGKSLLLTCVGADLEAKRLAGLLAEGGVSCELIEVTARPTIVKTRFASGQQQLLRLDREDPRPIPESSEEQVIAAARRHLEDCALLVISDYSKGVLTDRVLRQAIEMARQRGVPIFIDPKRRDFSIYKGATLLKPNKKELEAATGLPVTTDTQIIRAAAAAATETGAIILVTRSESGMSLVRPDCTSVHMPTQAREVYDVTGAGDTVMAALALGVASGYPLEEAMALANVAGGIAVSKHGTAMVSAEELEAERSLIADLQTNRHGDLMTLEQACNLRRVWKRQGLTVGFTNGCFDIIHPGHISLLRGAAAACDRLIVGLNSDMSVRRLKGAGRPVQTEADRATVVGAIEGVDAVVIFEQDTPAELIGALVPDVLVKGADYKIDEIVGADTVKAAGGRVMTVDLVPGKSTTRLIDAGRKAAAAE
jgi:D-beta-D-heptose 7-phosphate kinase/D-beta-D-heptose 1-phosphate adenosyltransferase